MNTNTATNETSTKCTTDCSNDNQNYSPKQLYCLDNFKKNKNIFITGPGGSGKSFLINKLQIHAKNEHKNIQICALTGCASVLLGMGSKTLHSWSGIGAVKGSKDHILFKILKQKKICKNWKDVDILIIDEVSMMSKQIFELLDYIARRIRKSDKIFGGIQLICCGDFFQLSPIGNALVPESKQFCFESELWKKTFEHQIILDKIYRQNDENYISILQEIRQGHLSKNSYNIIQKRLISNINKNTNSDNNSDNNLKNKHIIRLVSTTKEANNINTQFLKSLKTESKIYKYSSKLNKPIKEEEFSIFYKKNTNLDNSNNDNDNPTPYTLKQEEKYMIKNSRFDEKLELKLNSKVMCIINLDVDNGICNGSIGTITEIGNNYVKVMFNNGIEKKIIPYAFESSNIPQFEIKQIPLILAWAITIHKSQGITLDNASMNLGDSIFTYGQTYVALSRVKSLDGLYLESFNPHKIRSNPIVKEFYQSIS